MIPMTETLLLTLNVELGQKSSLKCKQLWHFITKSTSLFQNALYCKLQGHFHLPSIMASAPGGASCVEPKPGEGDVEIVGVSTSEISPSFTVWQQGFIRGNPEQDFHIKLLNRNKKRANAAFGSDGPPSSLQAFQGAFVSVRDRQRQKRGTSPTKCLG